MREHDGPKRRSVGKMAQTATALDKGRAGPPAFASVSASDVIRAPIVQRMVPLDFAVLLKPFKSHGRLSLRVENVPQRARLSAGRNNGDGSWSLASDELEELTYSVPSNFAVAHELTIRIMFFDGETASTLKLTRYQIPALVDDQNWLEQESDLDLKTQKHDPLLRSQLEKMQSLFAVRDSDLAELRTALEQAKSQSAADLASARAEWEIELKERLAEAAAQEKAQREREEALRNAKQKSDQARADSEIERKVASEKSNWKRQLEQKNEAERQRISAQAEERSASDRRKLEAQFQHRMEAELKRWETEKKAELLRAGEGWRAEEAKRFAAAQAEWQQQSTHRLAEQADKFRKLEEKLRASLKQQAPVLNLGVGGGQLDQLERQLETANTALRAREMEIAQDRAAWEVERGNWRQQVEASMSAAAKSWKNEEGVRTEAAVRESCARLEEALAAANSRYEGAERALAEARAWKNDENARTEAAVRTLRAQLEEALAAATMRHQDAERALAEAKAWKNEERARTEAAVRESCARLEEALAAAIMRHQDAERALAEAKAWKNEERTRTEAAIRESCAQFEEALAAATMRYQSAERALAAGKSPTAAAGTTAEDAYVERLRTDVSDLRIALASREVELGHARAILDQTSKLEAFRTKPDNADDGTDKSLVRDFMIVVFLVVPAILFYPDWAGYLPESIRTNLAAVTGGLLNGAGDHVSVTSRPVQPPAAPTPKPLTATLSRAANMHASPSAKGTVEAILPRDAAVTVLQQHGNWTLIETVPANTATKVQGWVFTAYLKGQGDLGQSQAVMGQK